jgi:hypothetical protein
LEESLKEKEMPKACGIELKSSETILVVVENSAGTIDLVDTTPI